MKPVLLSAFIDELSKMAAEKDSAFANAMLPKAMSGVSGVMPAIPRAAKAPVISAAFKDMAHTPSSTFTAAAQNAATVAPPRMPKVASVAVERVLAGTEHYHSPQMLAMLQALPAKVYFAKEAEETKEAAAPPPLPAAAIKKPVSDMGKAIFEGMKSAPKTNIMQSLVKKGGLNKEALGKMLGELVKKQTDPQRLANISRLATARGAQLASEGADSAKKYLAVGTAAAQRMSKAAAELTQATRSHLPKKDFAVPASKSNTGEKAYPIPDRQHARSALGFAKMHGDSADLERVKAKIQAKYPDMLKDKAAAAEEQTGVNMSAPSAILRSYLLGGAGGAAIGGLGPMALGARSPSLKGALLGGGIGAALMGGATHLDRTVLKDVNERLQQEQLAKGAAIDPGAFKRFREAAIAELGPATGAVLGAGAANAIGVNPLAGAAAGYGLGAIPEIIHGVKHRSVAGAAPAAAHAPTTGV